MAYDAVVFDNDGVLTTPTRAEALVRAMESALASIGVTDPPETAVETLLRPDLPSLEAIAARYDVDAGTLWRRRERAAIEAQREELRAGRKRLYDDVPSVRELERPQAIVSNNQHETIENVVTQYDLDWFEPWYGREPTLEGIQRKKPRPYYLERALAEMGASEPLYVGDSWVDVAAANAAGIDSAFIRREHRDGYDPLEYDLDAGPTYEIESLSVLADLC